MEFNYTQSELIQDDLQKEVFTELIDALDAIQFCKNLISKDRKFAKDLEKDELGRIKVDITNPHILEDMDYFRQAAIHQKTYGIYTRIHPNSHPNSAYAKFWKEEARRCRAGYVRESDGEWIPGPFYYFLNYSPMLITEIGKTGRKGSRIEDFPDIYDGDYLFYHYVQQASDNGKHVGLLKKRGAGFSYKSASGLGRLFILGDTEEVKKNVSAFAIASEKEFLTKDGILNKFVDNVNWNADFTPWSRIKLKESFNEMQWVMGYKDPDGIIRGTQNTVIGVTTQGNPDKARGKRGTVYWEEWGKFPNLLKSWEVARHSVEEGDVAFATMIGGGTGGVEGADFRGAEELYYNPVGYGILALPNVFDRNTDEKSICAYFFPAYMNRLRCYDENGNSDIIASLTQILNRRVEIKYNSSDINTLVQHKAEMPITPQEAIMRREGSGFPVADLKEQLATASVDIGKFISPHYIGHLKYTNDGTIAWDQEAVHPVIREYPIKDQLDRNGNIEIFEMPKKGFEGKIPYGRYIAGIDPIDSDQSTYTNSLGSIFIFDLWTDRIVAEYTGRSPRAIDFYDIVLRLLKFYNAQANYESNLKGLFSFMERNAGMHYLCDTPQILKDMEYVKGGLIGNSAKGTNANKLVNAWGRKLQADWMISPAYSITNEEEDNEVDSEGNKIEKTKRINVNTIRSIGYMKEAIAWNSDDNFDRVSAMGMCMILREERQKYADRKFEEKVQSITNDKWFNRNGGFSKKNKVKSSFGFML